ncbi:NAD-P-binding protein [Stereum hirsutum FP-91666 SS1]|uniref:NAD-P-binding protein n=1 Tax=Stereum hirsutum (strain FP-91666) TaxID=721885 RepID=UPI0004449321|nr:NAD-P-binding protein [Stereum hirsutum FP-91666 SS1]EIM83298.1 NAD-P-binding protein [Stereum hirsutum FP-91666 SS1]
MAGTEEQITIGESKFEGSGAPVGANESALPGVSHRTDVYPYIDPKIHYASQAFKNKVVFITGASQGIGEETARQYARAGATLVLAARSVENLERVKKEILTELPKAQILTVKADVVVPEEVKAAVDTAVAKFGKLDIVIANAGMANSWTQPLAEMDPNEWWRTIEVNLRGVYNTVHYSIPHLNKTKGSIVAVSSIVAQVRVPNASNYCLSKHAIGRLIEYITIEYPNIRAFSVNPGGVETDTNRATGIMPPGAVFDTAALPAATFLYLTSGKADWLSGRYYSANWDLGEVEKDWKKQIVENEGLVAKLVIPAK